MHRQRLLLLRFGSELLLDRLDGFDRPQPSEVRTTHGSAVIRQIDNFREFLGQLGYRDRLVSITIASVLCRASLLQRRLELFSCGEGRGVVLVLDASSVLHLHREFEERSMEREERVELDQVGADVW